MAGQLYLRETPVTIFSILRWEYFYLSENNCVNIGFKE